MTKRRTTKEIAQRVDPTYFRRWHRLRRTRFLLSLGLFTAAVVWVAAGASTMYASGPVSSGHALFEADCATCHTEDFGPVHDAACLQCHTAGPHMTPDKGTEPACAACHKDHEGRGSLSDTPDRACARCHTDHADIRTFADHVRFRIEPREQHLRFGHQMHLDEKLIDGPLECASCHVPGESRRGFAPIRFAAHCAKCHIERIDEGGEEIVPHGMQPEDLRPWIAAGYLERGGHLPVRASAVPGRGSADPPDWAEALRRKTDEALEALFKPGRKRGCLLCHDVDRGRIVPPAVPVRWLDRALFDHHTHAFEACDRCHDMSENQKAEDSGLPGIVTCRTCHQPEGARITCVTCHPYHPR